MPHIHDFIAIGLGPFNLSLAALTDTQKDIDALFIEKRDTFDWHPGMMLDDVTLQTPFMSDLVTLADPTSPYSFLNYAKTQGKLYSFYIRESFFLLRKEYNQYCQWVCQSLSNVRFSSEVTSVTFDANSDSYQVTVAQQGKNTTYFAKKLVLGTGPKPHMPQGAEHLGDKVLHSGAYLANKAALTQAKSITVVGGGQSAAEIYYDLMSEHTPNGPHINWITRSERYFPLEYTKLTLEMTSPEYVDYFYNLPAKKRDALIGEQKNLYKGINSELINGIFDLLYRLNLSHPPKTTLKTHSSLEAITPSEHGHTLTFHHQELDKYYQIESDYVVMATGFKPEMPNFLNGVSTHIPLDDQGRYKVSRDYAIDTAQSRIFVQNAELHTHGFVTPDLGMACYRNSVILKAITGREVYPIEQKIAFQQFDLSDVDVLDDAKGCAA